MPHGGGHHGGGGGGGFYGGTYAGHHHHGKRCSGACFCCMFVTAILIGCILAPCILVFGTYKDQTIYLSPRATRLKKLNTFWNRMASASVEDIQTDPVKAFFVSERPFLLPEQDRFTGKTNAILFWDDFQYWSFYLIPPSSAQLVVKTSQSFEFYLIRGEGNFQNWANSDDTKHNNKSIAGYKYTPRHSGSNSVTVFNGSVSKEDVYFFVLARDRHIGYDMATLDLELSIQRSLYDTRNLDTQCDFRWDTNCDNDLTFTSNQYILFQAPNASDVMSTTFKPNVMYTPRELIYFGLFGGCGLIILALLVALCCRAYRKRRQARVVVTTTAPRPPLVVAATVSERQPLVSAATAIGANKPPSYSSVQPQRPAGAAAPAAPSYPAAALAAPSDAHAHRGSTPPPSYLAACDTIQS